MKTFFSLIIPTLNEEKYLPRLLRCIGKQTLRDFETIIVDGGSTDRTVEVALEYADKVIVEEGNQAKARNLGARVSTGRYLVFLDADAAIDADFLEKAKELFDEYDPKGVKCILGRPEPIARTKLGRAAFAFGWLLCKLKATFPGYMGILIERGIFEKIGGFNPSLAYGEDLDLIVRASRLTKLLYPRDLVVYSDTRRWMREGKLDIVETARIIGMVIDYLTTKKSHGTYRVIR
ncbi:MAG: glycosyltransferase [Candidatus Nezhaarchaeales archaeon]